MSVQRKINVLKAFIFSFMLLSILEGNESKVAILGESYNSQNGTSGINEVILGRLFGIIKEKNPGAVIFTGNMTLGLDKKLPEDFETTVFVQRPSVSSDAGIEEEQWPREGFKYDGGVFQRQLEAFLNIKNASLGDKIPFYPIIGNHEAFGTDAAFKVISVFGLKSTAPATASTLAYTFSLNNSLFILFSNARFDAYTQSTEEHRLGRELLEWLNQVLSNQRAKYDFAFVIGNEPAFSTTASNGIFKGLDKNIDVRNKFWKILLDHQVTAYFCSGERLYDRTNRYGIWQIISGGSGAPLYKREFDKAFYHFLLLSVPNNPRQLPKVQVYDSQGNLADEFDLSPFTYPVYQLRISSM